MACSIGAALDAGGSARRAGAAGQALTSSGSTALQRALGADAADWHEQRPARRRNSRAVFPGAAFVAIRGNVDTRLRKLDAGDCDALVLAAAGLKRLGLDARISALAARSTSCVPAPGQGIVADRDRRRRCAPDVRHAVAAHLRRRCRGRADRRARRGGGARRRLPDAARRARADASDLIIDDSAVSSRWSAHGRRATHSGGRARRAATGGSWRQALLAVRRECCATAHR